ncbi:MAG: apolipoprotein N-acyltransferase [Cyanobacteria bacterium M_surface_7_m2_040]|nr:apolipoprotein N-acyltransferase [Cyanobacteria bacterium M_surface_7_m2_040]
MAAGRWGWKLELILSAGFGLVAGLAVPPLGQPPLLWLALAGLWAAAAQALRPFWCGALWGFAALALSHRWLLALHPLDWIGVPLPLSLPLCVALLVLIAALAGALVGLWVRLARWLDPRRVETALLLALLWGVAEGALAKGPLFWLGLGASALPGDRPLAALAALGGSGLVCSVQLLIGWLLWRLWRGQARRRLAAALLAALLGAHLLGAALLAAQPLAGPSQRVLVLQPAIPTRDKFTAPQQLRLRRQLLAALAQGAAQGADLLVLPEGALGLEPRLAEPAPIELISGGFRWHQGVEALQQRSSLLRFAAGEQQPSSWLDKHRLVPLGEWVPLASWVRWSGLSAVGGIEPGPPSRLLPRPNGALAAAICYELSDGAALAAAVRDGASWLLASANLDPYPPQLQQQFTALAQLRALETGRWVVSAANTGPSLLINPRGAVQAQLPLGVAGTALVTVPLLTTLTPYDRCGELPLLLLTAAALAWRWARRTPR